METPEARIKRLRMRSMRRGIKEMDLILAAFAVTDLLQMAGDHFSLYDQLLSENDHDIYGWIGGQFAVPDHYAPLIEQIAQTAHGVTRPA